MYTIILFFLYHETIVHTTQTHNCTAEQRLRETEFLLLLIAHNEEKITLGCLC